MSERRKYEDTVLSQVLLDNGVWHSLPLKAEHFAGEQQRKLYHAIEKVISLGGTAQIDTVYSADKSLNPAYLSRVGSAAHTAANWEFYAGELDKEYKRDAIRAACRETIELCDDDVSGALAKLDERISDMMRGRQVDKIYPVGDLVYGYLHELEERYSRKGQLPGLTSGLGDLDEYLLGFRPSRLYIFGGRPSAGKSALLLTSARRLSDKRTSVGFISLESSKEEVLERLVSALGKVNSKSLASGALTPADFKSVNDGMSKIHDLPFFIYDSPNQTLQQVKSQIRRMVNVFGVRCVFVDYLQLIRVPGQDDRRGEVARASTELKDLARELAVPIVAAAQLNRDADEKRPHMGSFQWSSQIEQDADAAILIWRRPAETEKSIKMGEAMYEHVLLVEKNRDGNTGMVPVTFVAQYVSFEERAQGGYDGY